MADACSSAVRATDDAGDRLVLTQPLAFGKAASSCAALAARRLDEMLRTTSQSSHPGADRRRRHRASVKWSCTCARRRIWLTVQAKEQQLGRGFGEMEEREGVEAHPRLVRRIHSREEFGFAHRAVFADRRNDLHRVFEARRPGTAKHVRPQLHDAAQQDEIPARFVLGARKEQLFVGAEPGPELGLLVPELSEPAEEQCAVQRRNALVRPDGQGIAVRMNARSAPTSMWAARCASCSAESIAVGAAAPSKSSHSPAAMTYAPARGTTNSGGGTERSTASPAHSRVNTPMLYWSCGGAVFRRDDLDRPMAVECFEGVPREAGRS